MCCFMQCSEFYFDAKSMSISKKVNQIKSQGQLRVLLKLNVFREYQFALGPTFSVVSAE